MAACGPAVGTDDSASGGQSSGTSEPPGTSAAEVTSVGDVASGDDSSSSFGGAPVICGDGVVDEGEACDDGNTENADGCSAACETRGSIRWVESLPSGFAIGLSAREGRVAAGLQQYTGGLDPATVLVGFESSGAFIGEYTDEGGFSDRDIAREPIALLPDGRVALGYAVLGARGGPVQRHFGVLDFDEGIVGSYLDEELTGAEFFGTTYNPQGTLVLRADRNVREPILVLQQFDDTAALIESFPLDLSADEYRPLPRGAVPERTAPMGLVFTVTPFGGIDLHTSLLAPSWYSTPIADAGGRGAVASFSDELGLRLWTGSELILFDGQDHQAESQPLSFDGELLWADADGLVVGREETIVLYDPLGVEQASTSLSIPDGPAMRAQFVRPDPVGGGVFVLADAGIPPDPTTAEPAVLLYVVR